jgi:N-acetylneuraminic acid mutarotase
VFENEILSLGHEHQDAKEDEIWVYDPDCDSWTKYAKTPPRANLTSAICCQICPCRGTPCLGIPPKT